MTPCYAGVGARATPPEVLRTMGEWGRRLAREGWTLRSGGAQGADFAFEAAARSVNAPMEIMSAHDRTAPGWSAAWRLAEENHPAWQRCSDHVRALHARNGLILCGRDMSTPVRFVLAWTPDGTPVGGTGQTLRMARSLDLPVVNLALGTKDEQARQIEHYITTAQIAPRTSAPEPDERAARAAP